MDKGKGKDLSTDWSNFVWEDDYQYQYPEPPQHVEQTPRTHGLNVISTNDFIEPSDLITPPLDDFYGSPRLGNDTNYSHSAETNVAARDNLPDDETSTDREAGFAPVAAPIQTQYPGSNLSPLSPGPSTSAYLEYNDQGRSSEYDENYSSGIVKGLQNLSMRSTVEQGSSAPLQSEWTFGQSQLPEQTQAFPENETYEETLDQRYREIPNNERKSFWRIGRVFMTPWTEAARESLPNKGGGTHISYVWLNGKVYTEIRRFVVISVGYGNCLCSPIHTYDGKATLKSNLPESSQHTIIYTGDKAPVEQSYIAEDGRYVTENLSKDPIRVVGRQDATEGQLHHASRLNYSKIYTVEDYVRVLNIGMVHKNSMASLESNSLVQRKDRPQGPQRHPPRSGHGGGSRGRHSKPNSGGGSRSQKSGDNPKESRRTNSNKK